MRGKVVRTTSSDGKAPCPLVKVNLQFRAERPNHWPLQGQRSFAVRLEDQGAVELATLEWVSCFYNHRLLEPIGYIPAGRG